MSLDVVADAGTQSTAAAVRRIGRQKIIHGDCLDALATMIPGSVDLVVTSPPYNIGVAYRCYHDRKPREQYLAWLSRVGRALTRVLRDDGALFLNVGSAGSVAWLAMDAAGAFRDSFVLQNHVAWVKSVSI